MIFRSQSDFSGLTKFGVAVGFILGAFAVGKFVWRRAVQNKYPSDKMAKFAKKGFREVKGDPDSAAMIAIWRGSESLDEGIPNAGIIILDDEREGQILIKKVDINIDTYTVHTSGEVLHYLRQAMKESAIGGLNEDITVGLYHLTSDRKVNRIRSYFAGHLE